MQRSTDFHRRFAAALQNPDIDCLPLLSDAAANQRRRFDVYRNNRAMSLIDSLRSTYPAVCKLTGEAFFGAAARSYIDRYPPPGPVMAEFGSEFSAHLQTLPNSEKVPYLADVAKLEWRWLQCYHSADAAVLELSALAQLSGDEITDVSLVCHPALFAMKSAWPIGSIWTVCTQGEQTTVSAASVDMKQAECVVITRPGIQVLTNIVPEPGWVFLNALQTGSSIGDAAELALQTDKDFQVGEHLAGQMALGAFCSFRTTKKSNR